MNKTEQSIREKVNRYLAGELNSEEADGLWMDFMQHPEWLEILETETALRQIIAEGPYSVQEPVSESLIRKNKWHIAAAVLLLLVISLQLIREYPETSLTDFYITEFSPSFAEQAHNFRDDPDFTNSEARLLNRGYLLLDEGREQEAGIRFDSLLGLSNHPPYRAAAHFNLALLAYNSGDLQHSLQRSDSVMVYTFAEQEVTYLIEKNHWLRSHALLRLGRTKEAVAELNKVHRLNGYHSSEAFEILIMLSKMKREGRLSDE